MADSNVIVGLDIGTTKILCLVSAPCFIKYLIVLVGILSLKHAAHKGVTLVLHLKIPKLELIADLSHGNTDITCPYSKMKWHTSATLGLFKGVLAWDLDNNQIERKSHAVRLRHSWGFGTFSSVRIWSQGQGGHGR